MYRAWLREALFDACGSMSEMLLGVRSSYFTEIETRSVLGFVGRTVVGCVKARSSVHYGYFTRCWD